MTELTDATVAVRRRAREEIFKLREKLNSHKKGPCADCRGEFPPYVMVFDLTDEDLILTPDASDEQLASIADADLICANCLRIRAHSRKNSRG